MGEQLEIIGFGSYGKVYLRDGNAVKKISRLDHFLQEAISLSYLDNSKYILKLKKFSIPALELETELYQGDLSKLVKANGNFFQDQEVFDNVIKQIILGLIEIHDLNLVHGDIKPNNILYRFNQDKNIEVVIADCGFLSFGKYSKTERTARIFSEKHLSRDTKHDLFSLGMTMLYLKYEIRPKRQLLYSEIKGILETLPKNKYTSAIENLTQEDKSRRFNARELYNFLFGEQPELTRRVSPHNFSNLLKKYDKPKNEFFIKLRNDFKELSAKHEINRAFRGYLALCYLLESNNQLLSSFNRDIRKLIMPVLIILSSIFGKKDLAREFEKTQEFNEILEMMIKDKIFLEILFSS
jgi:serine/threonine protein kinase